MKILMIVAKEMYRDEEYDLPKKIFEENGFEVITASKEVGECTSKTGKKINSTISINDLDVSDYDAIIFVGGSGAKKYQHDVQAHLTAQEAVNRGKVLAAICIASTILAYAGVLEGVKATSWNKDNLQGEFFKSRGAIYTGEDVTIDGKIVTANGPEAAEKFAQAIVKLLKTE